jgi:hypothetical protein
VSPQSQRNPLQFFVPNLVVFTSQPSQFINVDAAELAALRTQIPLLIHVLVLYRSSQDNSIGNAEGK